MRPGAAAVCAHALSAQGCMSRVSVQQNTESDGPTVRRLYVLGYNYIPAFRLDGCCRTVRICAFVSRGRARIQSRIVSGEPSIRIIRHEATQIAVLIGARPLDPRSTRGKCMAWLVVGISEGRKESKKERKGKHIHPLTRKYASNTVQ